MLAIHADGEVKIWKLFGLSFEICREIIVGGFPDELRGECAGGGHVKLSKVEQSDVRWKIFCWRAYRNANGLADRLRRANLR